jgi:hypothetical protein
MSADLQWMEHRWGTRIDLDAPAEIATLDGASGACVVKNASLSGALAETSVRPALLSRVSLKPGTQGGVWIEGCVVRVEGNVVAIEWLDPPLHAVARLLSFQHATASGQDPAAPGRTVVSLLDWQQAQG